VVPLPRTDGWITALARRFTRSADRRSPPRPCPRRYGYLEAACMAREMDGL